MDEPRTDRPLLPRRTAAAVVAGSAALALLLTMAAVPLGGLYGELFRIQLDAALRDPVVPGRAATAEQLAEQRLAERLPELVAFVEREMGAEFAGVPPVELLDADDFEDAVVEDHAHLEPDDADPDEDLAAALAALTALGVVEDEDLFVDTWWSSGGAIGYFEASAQRLVVLADQGWTPVVETTVVHELVHALQHQEADLEAAGAATDDADESWPALSTVVEGQAVVVEIAWLDSRSEDYVEAYWDEYGGGSGDEPVDPWLEGWGVAPYDVGFESVSALLQTLGPAEVTALIADPPTSMEQAAHLAAWLDGDPELADPVDVPVPPLPDGAQELTSGVLGGFSLLLMGLDQEDWSWAFEHPVPTAWHGDAFVAYTLDDDTCVLADVATGEGDVQGLVEHLQPWLDGGGRLSEQPGGVLRLERCAD